MEKHINYIKGMLPIIIEYKYITIVIAILFILLLRFLFKRRPKNSLKGKKNLGIVITGGSRGIGFSLTKEFLKLNHRVVICATSKDTLEKALKELSNKNLFGIICNVTNEKEVEKLSKFSVEKLGSIDIWINNAGISAGGLDGVDEVEPKIFSDVVTTNLIGSFYCSKYALQIFKKQNHGHLFQLMGFGSHGAFRKGLTTYGTTKWALVYLARALASEISDTEVGSHRLYPGLTITDFITRGKEKVDKNIAWLCNIIGDLPDNVAKNVVPQICSIEGNDQNIEHVSQFQYTFRFMTSCLRTKKYFDSEGNQIFKS